MVLASAAVREQGSAAMWDALQVQKQEVTDYPLRAAGP